MLYNHAAQINWAALTIPWVTKSIYFRFCAEM